VKALDGRGGGSPRDFFIGLAALAQGRYAVDPRCCEGSRLELRLKLRQQSTRRDGVAFARIGVEELALVVVEVKEVEADAPIAKRRDLYQPAAMAKSRQRRLEHDAANRVENNLRHDSRPLRAGRP
jgi:hypothetical protein